MRRVFLPLAGLLIAWGLLLGAPACPPPAPQPTPTPCVTCPAGQHCEGGVCVADPPPPDPSPVCQEGETCGCWVKPPGEEWQQLPPCPPTPTCPATCPAGTACADPVAGCVQTPPVGSCTIPLNGTPLLGAYFLYPRIVDFTPKIQNAPRCALPEVGYPGRQACPVCDEACQQRGACEEALMGGAAPTFTCDSIALQCFSEDGWKVRVAGIGTGTLTACYPNRKACVTIAITCDAGGCKK